MFTGSNSSLNVKFAHVRCNTAVGLRQELNKRTLVLIALQATVRRCGLAATTWARETQLICLPFARRPLARIFESLSYVRERNRLWGSIKSRPSSQPKEHSQRKATSN